MQPEEEHEPMSVYPAIARQEEKERHEGEIAALKSSIRAVEEWNLKSDIEKLALILIMEKPPVDGSLESMYAKLRHLEDVAVFKE